MIGVNSITNEEELKAFVTAVAPYFYKYLASQSKNIFDCEVATNIENIKTMPALYDDGNGVRKQVVAPLQLLTKDVDAQIAAAKDAASKATASSQKADTAADSANAAAKKVTDAITDITQEKQAALDAAASANSEAAKAKTVTINATSATDSATAAATSATSAAALATTRIAEMEALAKKIAAKEVLKPEEMYVEYPADISIRNKVPQSINARLVPAYYPQNVIFQRARGNAIDVDPGGRLTINGTGDTWFYVIPPNNTALYVEIKITVRQPYIRLSGNGIIRMTNSGFRIV